MRPIRFAASVVLLFILAIAGTSWSQRPQPIAMHVESEPDTPMLPAGWVKSRLTVVDKKLDAEARDLLTLYQHLHANPELSLMEVKTAARLAEEMRKVGCEVTEKVGGNGIVAVMKNGAGPVVLVRTDMDALPITEQTGVPYASKVRMKDRSGTEVGVMHACGHDIHMA